VHLVVSCRAFTSFRVLCYVADVGDGNRVVQGAGNAV